MTQSCARQRLASLEAAQRARPAGRTHRDGAGRVNPGNSRQSMRAATRKTPCTCEGHARPSASAHRTGKSPCTCTTRPWSGVAAPRAGRSPCAVRSAAPQLPRARPVPAAIPQGRANADARKCPQMNANEPEAGIGGQRHRIGRSLASRFGAVSPAPFAFICGHLRASAFPSFVATNRTEKRAYPAPTVSQTAHRPGQPELHAPIQAASGQAAHRPRQQEPHAPIQAAFGQAAHRPAAANTPCPAGRFPTGAAHRLTRSEMRRW